MSNYEVIETTAISHAQVADIIEKKEKEIELTYREEKIKEYLKNFSKLSLKDAQAALKDLEALDIPRIDQEHLIKIIDIMPQNGTELRAIVSHSGTVLVDENVTKILDVLKKYR